MCVIEHNPAAILNSKKHPQFQVQMELRIVFNELKTTLLTQLEVNVLEAFQSKKNAK